MNKCRIRRKMEKVAVFKHLLNESKSNSSFHSCPYYPLKIPRKCMFWIPFLSRKLKCRELKRSRSQWRKHLYDFYLSIFPAMIDSRHCVVTVFYFFLPIYLFNSCSHTGGNDSEVSPSSPTHTSEWHHGELLLIAVCLDDHLGFQTCPSASPTAALFFLFLSFLFYLPRVIPVYFLAVPGKWNLR